jgi:hypothetical protein
MKFASFNQHSSGSIHECNSKSLPQATDAATMIKILSVLSTPGGGAGGAGGTDTAVVLISLREVEFNPATLRLLL